MENTKQRHESASGRISPFDSNLDFKTSIGGVPEQFSELIQTPLLAALTRTDGIDSSQMLYLKADANFKDIVTAMRSQATGVSFIKSIRRLLFFYSLCSPISS